MIFPWQIEIWQQLWRLRQVNRLPHALLFAGVPGIGKVHFADCFSRTFFCQAATIDGDTCHRCHACRLITGRAHPNVLWVEPEKEGQAIKIDQIRAVTQFVDQSSLQGKYRIVVIHPADAMNANAANALLKTLEEPSSEAIMVLVSDKSGCLPATIVSRCQRVHFKQPQQELALSWLKAALSLHPTLDPNLLLRLAQGAPLAALALTKDDRLSIRQTLFQILDGLGHKRGDPIQSAATLTNIAPMRLLDFCLQWMTDLLRLQLGCDPDAMINKDYAEKLSALAYKTDLNKNTKWMEYIKELRRHLHVGINLNKQLMIESILIRWMGC